VSSLAAALASAGACPDCWVCRGVKRSGCRWFGPATPTCGWKRSWLAGAESFERLECARFVGDVVEGPLSFWKICLTCPSTVRWGTTRRLAIARLGRASASSASTSRSRLVSSSSGLASRRRPSRRETMVGSTTDSPSRSRRSASIRTAMSKTRSWSREPTRSGCSSRQLVEVPSAVPRAGGQTQAERLVGRCELQPLVALIRLLFQIS
jgi:hypothetical protein